MRATVIRGDARALPLADNSVDLVISSPPYFALRSYQDGGEHYSGQIGSESTPAEFVDALIEVTRECVRVLKPSGSLWINLGDKYSGYSGKNWGHGRDLAGERGDSRVPIAGPISAPDVYGIPAKSLMGIPWRYALRCIDDLGLILRAEVIWSKPNGLPESVTDRVRRSHEQWFHMVMQPRYYSAIDEIREAQTSAPNSAAKYSTRRQGMTDGTRGTLAFQFDSPNPLGKLPGSVLSIPTEPLKVPSHRVVRNGRTEAWFFSELDAWRYARRNGTRSGRPSIRPEIDHFAAFPLEWPRRIIQGWSPPGVCTACGEGRRPVVDKRYLSTASGYDSAGRWGLKGQPEDTPLPARLGDGMSATITGYACACPEPTAPTHPSVILDPFGGTGTTALAARALGCHGITVDMSQDYSRLARWRTTDEGELAKAMRVDKPAVQVDGQGSLLELIEEVS